MQTAHMTSAQLNALLAAMEAMVDVKIERAFGRDTLYESIALDKTKDELFKAFKLKWRQE